MRKRWYILAATAGTLAAAIVWQWPASPTWRSGPDAGWLQGFSPDGQIVVTARVPPETAIGFPDPEVCRFDAATGKLLSRVVFPCADARNSKAVRPSPDGRQAAVGEAVPGASTVSPFGPGDWYIHDADTGHRRVGPVKGLTMSPPHFSQDGRWLWGLRAESSRTAQTLERVAILSATTGEFVSLPDRNDLAMEWCLFSPDGASAAVYRSPRGLVTPDRRDTVHVFELPSGREIRRLDLPRAEWDLSGFRWDGRFLEAVEQLDNGLSKSFPLRRFVFDLSKDPVGEGVEEPLVSGQVSGGVEHLGYLDAGPDWVAYFTLSLPGSGPMDWLLEKIGGPLSPARRNPGVVYLADRETGETRFRAPDWDSYPCFVSPDGRWLARRAGPDAVEVWDTTRPAPPRWPWALAAGVVTAAGLLGFGWWRRPNNPPADRLSRRWWKRRPSG